MKKTSLVHTLKRLLQTQALHDQAEIVLAFKVQGLDVTQSQVSRLLRKIGAFKGLDIKTGKPVYQIPPEPPAPIAKTLTSLIMSIQHNHTLIVIKTMPGAAALIARTLDHSYSEEILGSIAGDDTVFVAPAIGYNLGQLQDRLKNILL